jgi:prepilin-type N-terminal cleavage/methylation domain-containing protein
MNKNLHKSQKGFTLIELLVVIGILAVLLAITLIAINPARQFANANDTQRRSEVTQILNAIGQYVAENQGQLPADIQALTVNTATPLDAGAAFPTLCADLVDEYLPALPKDPSAAGAQEVAVADCSATPQVWVTGYEIARDANGRITVSAPDAENATISVTR